MHYAEFVDVFDAGDYLLIHLRRLLFFQSSVFNDVLEEFTARAVFHYKIEIVVIFYHFVELYYMRVPYFFEYSYLPINPINITLIFNLVFFQYFNRNFISSYNMRSLLNLSKCPLPFSFSNNKPTNLFSFTILLFFFVFFFLFLVLYFWPFLIVVGGFGATPLLISLFLI